MCVTFSHLSFSPSLSTPILSFRSVTLAQATDSGQLIAQEAIKLFHGMRLEVSDMRGVGLQMQLLDGGPQVHAAPQDSRRSIRELLQARRPPLTTSTATSTSNSSSSSSMPAPSISSSSTLSTSTIRPDAGEGREIRIREVCVCVCVALLVCVNVFKVTL